MNLMGSCEESTQGRALAMQLLCSFCYVYTHRGKTYDSASGGGNVAVKAHRVQKVSSRGADCEGGLLKESPQL